ncbi:type 4a pilus biogenesis protein PilO [Amphibiibacter pelophylacis]|uniref:Type 4a pilus biogenesis protein PilO n=1 Tax=Amphibiibacter pelophylacis TaxID=1799477 RepID=A0ACC6P4A1_9BURK
MMKSLRIPKLSPGGKPRSKKPAPAKPKVSLRQQLQSVQSQFRGLDPNDPAKWPLLPRIAAWTGIGLLGVGLVWLALIRDQSTALSDAQATEANLRQEYRGKLVQAVNIESLQVQKRQVEDFVQQLEKQLPSKAEMAALLSDINQAGMSQGLKFELFRPGAEVIRDYYAELPIAIRVTGKYGQMGHFASELANLSRIVTLEGITLAPAPDSASAGTVGSARKTDASNPDLVMDATARTYRYLDAAEVLAQRELKDGNKTAGAKK